MGGILVLFCWKGLLLVEVFPCYFVGRVNYYWGCFSVILLEGVILGVF